MIQLYHLTKRYSGGTSALSDVNLEVRRGEFVSVMQLSPLPTR